MCSDEGVTGDRNEKDYLPDTGIPPAKMSSLLCASIAGHLKVIYFDKMAVLEPSGILWTYINRPQLLNVVKRPFSPQFQPHDNGTSYTSHTLFKFVVVIPFCFLV